MSVNIIPKPSYPDLKRASDYTEDLKNDGAKVAVDENGPMTGGFNFLSEDRPTQLIEFQAHLNRNKNDKAKALQHLVFSYDRGIVPTHAQIRRHFQIYQEVIGAEGQMDIYDCHQNTDNFHTHHLFDRLSNAPDEKGKYRILNNGRFKKLDKKGNWRTDESICRQVAIARICKEEGWPPPDGLAYDENGKPIPRRKKQEKTSFEGIPSKADRLAAIGWEIFQTSKERREPVERLLAQGINIQLAEKNGKIVGATLIANDGTRCGFARMNPGEKGLFKKLSKKFALAPDDEYGDPARVSPFQAEEALRTLMRPVFQEPARFGNDWQYLINAVEAYDAHLERSGGGLIVVRNGVKITTSSIYNKCSFSKLEKILGPCPILKAAPTVPSARDALIRDSVDIISRWVERSRGLFQARPELQKIGIQIERKTSTKDGERIKYYVLTRNGVSIPFSALGRDTDGNPYTFNRLRLLDACDPSARHAAWLEWANSQSEVGRQSREAAPMQPFTGTPHNLPGVPFLSEIRDQITRGYHHVARIIGIERIETHHLGHSAGTPASN